MNVFLIAALTVDGFIAQSEGQVSTSWTSEEDKKWFHRRTKEAGLVIMGSKTFATVNRAMSGRQSIVMTRDPQGLQERSNGLVRPLAELPERAGEILEAGVYTTEQDPNSILEIVKNKKYSEIAICGGSSVYRTFVQAGLVDELWLTIEPQLFGKGWGLFDQELNVKLQLLELQQLSPQTILLHYAVHK